MKNNKNKQLLFGIIGIAILVIVVGVTYAFFSYTRTGNTNTVQAGRIVFNSTQGDAINLSNAFPITSAQALTDTTNAKTLQITVSGDTSYSRGLEYLVTATDVHMTTTTGKTVPVTIEVSVTGNNSKTLGTSNNDYYTNRGGNTSMYNVEYDGSLDENDHILIGYIAPDNNQTGVDGIINIKTYFNDADILITDTPDTVDTAGKTVLSTTEWNSLKGNYALSFKIKVEAREGTWVTEPPKNLKNLIMSRVGQDGIVAINTSGELASSGDIIREYRYSGGGRYCTYQSPDGNTTYKLQIEGDTCPETAIYGGGPPSLWASSNDIFKYSSLSGTTYTSITTTVQDTGLRNYITFNNEMWRIIGVFNDKVKIMKDLPIRTENVTSTYTNLAGTTYTIKNDSPTGTKYAPIFFNNGGDRSATSDWKNAGLMYYLNEETTGRTSEYQSYYDKLYYSYKSLIDTTTYTLGNVDISYPANQVYDEERATPVECASTVTNYSNSNNCNIWNGNSATWTGKISLPYPSDLGYASSSLNWSKNISSYWSMPNSPIVSDNWFLHTDAFFSWFLSPTISNNIYPLGVYESGYVSNSDRGAGYVAVRPVLYLKSNTLVYSGDGSYSNSYQLLSA